MGRRGQRGQPSSKGISDETLRAWAARYLATSSSTQATRDVGITAKSEGALYARASRLLARARKAGYLERAVAAIETPSKMEAAEVIERLSRLARADVGDYLRFDGDGRACGDIEVRRGQTYGIAEYTVSESVGEKTTTTTQKLKLRDSLRALEALARIYGLDGTRSPEEPPITRMRAGFLALLADPVTREQVRALSLAALRAPIETTAVRLPPVPANGGGGNGHG